MKTKRLRVLTLLFAALLLAILLAFLWPSNEPTYQGKSVSVWFEEYALPRSPPPLWTIQGPGGRVIQIQGPSENLPNPAWEALWQFGSNGVPYIASYLRTGFAESPHYTRILTNLPASLRSKLPNPVERRIRRHAAAKAIAALGEAAQSAGPVLLAELKRSDVTFHDDLLRALWSIGVESHLITKVALELGQDGKYSEMISIVGRTGCGKEEAVARLLGEALTEQDPGVRTRALQLLEKAGPCAIPALPGIISSAGHVDSETRYLAVRALRAIGTNTPAIANALRARLNDNNDLVRSATQRTLLQFELTTRTPEY